MIFFSLFRTGVWVNALSSLYFISSVSLTSSSIPRVRFNLRIYSAEHIVVKYRFLKKLNYLGLKYFPAISGHMT